MLYLALWLPWARIDRAAFEIGRDDLGRQKMADVIVGHLVLGIVKRGRAPALAHSIDEATAVLIVDASPRLDAALLALDLEKDVLGDLDLLRRRRIGLGRRRRSRRSAKIW